MEHGQLGKILGGLHAIFLPESVTLVFSFRIKKFKQKSAILAGKIGEFREAIFPLTENTTTW
jgi:hypothetical protein